jgi:hypothetical protein
VILYIEERLMTPEVKNMTPERFDRLDLLEMRFLLPMMPPAPHTTSYLVIGLKITRA